MSRDGRRLLYIAPTMPSPTGNGLAMRAASLLDALGRQFQVALYVVPVAGGPLEVPDFVRDRTVSVGVLDLAAGLEAQAALIGRIGDAAERRRQRLAYPRPWLARFSGEAAFRRMAAWTDGTRFDALHVMRLYLAPLGLRYARESPLPASLDLDEDDARLHDQIAGLHDRRGEPAPAAQARAEAGRYASLARTSLAAFRTVLTSAAADAERLAQAHPGARLAVVPNIYPAAPIPPRAARPPDGTLRLLFVGTFGYLPNADAAAHLVRDILPVLRQGAGDIEIDLVGSGGTPAMLGPGAVPPCVHVHGHVSDVGPWYERADIAVVPLRAGGGSRIKILEAFAHRVPVVSTRTGAEGLDAVHDQHLLLADDPAEFARACHRLHRDGALRTRLTSEAAALLGRRYSQACVQAALDASVRLEK